MSASSHDLPSAGRRPRNRFFALIMSLAMVGPMLGFSAALPSTAIASSTDHFAIDPINPQQAGTAFTVTVTALTSGNVTDTSYTGGAALSGLATSPGCPDCAPALVATPADHGGAGSWTNGVGTYSVTAYNAESNAQLTVTDPSAANPSADSNMFDVSPATGLEGFTVDTVGAQVAGSAFPVTVKAYDLYGNFNTTYAGSPTLTGLATSPGCSGCTPALLATAATYGTLGSWLNGSNTFTGVLAYNAQTDAQLTVSDGSTSNVSNTFGVGPAAALAGFTFANIGTKTAGVSMSVTVTAYDLYGNVNTNYAGGAGLSALATSPGCAGCAPPLSAAAPLPGSVLWTDGVGAWTGVTPFKAETAASFTVTDGSISNTSNTFLVNNGVPLGGFTIDPIADKQAGTAFTVTVRAYDLYGNPKTDYSGGTLSGLATSPGCSGCTPALSATAATYVPLSAWSNGVRTYTVTAYNAQTGAHVTVTDGSVSNTSNDFGVSPATALKGFTIATIGTKTAGTGFPVTVTSYDLYGNVNTTYAGGATLSGLATSPGCSLCTPALSATPADHGNPGSWTAGVGTYNVTAYTAQANAQLTVTDTPITNVSNTFTVNPATALKGLTINSIGSPQTAATAFNVTVKAYDLYGNLNSNITSGVGLSGLASSPGCGGGDCTPTISPEPATYGSASWSGGVGTFTGVLAYNSEAGAQITATGAASVSNVSSTFTVNPAGETKLLFNDSNVGFAGQPIDTKFNEPIYSFCNPLGAVAPHPCATAPSSPPSSPSSSSATKVLAIDQYGNRVSSVSVTIGTSPGTTLLGTNPMTTQSGTPGVAPYGEAWFNTLSIAATNTYQLTAIKTGVPSVKGMSGKFRIVQDLQACAGSHQCKNNTGNGKTGNFIQYAFGQITSGTTTASLYSDVLLTTQFTAGSETSNQCGKNRTIGDSTELRAAGPTVSTTSAGYLVLIIPKNTLKADGVLSRGTPSFNVCLGALYLGDGTPGSYGGLHTAWIGKKTSGNGLAGANPVPDALSGFIRYWAPPANCGTAGLHADGSDPCIYLRTKQKSDITALVNAHILAPGADANMHDADMAIVIYKPNPWDGKGGMY